MTEVYVHACTHKTYRMTCVEFEALRGRAAGMCERCGVECDALQIDHDHAQGLNAVRGLLCRLCNARLAKVEAGDWERDALDDAYLECSWWTDRGLALVEDLRTPVRTFRTDLQLWEAAQAKAARRRETVAAVIKRALLAYVEDEPEE